VIFYAFPGVGLSFALRIQDKGPFPILVPLAARLNDMKMTPPKSSIQLAEDSPSEASANSEWAAGLDNWLRVDHPSEEMDPYHPSEIVWEVFERQAAEEESEERYRSHRHRIELPEMLPDLSHL
jgi:hypothetical protein